ncbi:hypothetical protein [Staphylococcus auricularis]|uniref:hypothetical protein n=1 Tax=Staphylococcus auricularis TaxID=29379 RepID=UPI00242D691E|nr:hypothetical protein [Staphylococcus auricularis]
MEALLYVLASIVSLIFAVGGIMNFLFGKHDPTDFVLLIFIISLIATIFYMVIVINREIKKD